MVGSSRFVHHRKEVPEELVPLNIRVKVNVNPVSVCRRVCVLKRKRMSDWGEFHMCQSVQFLLVI